MSKLFPKFSAVSTLVVCAALAGSAVLFSQPESFAGKTFRCCRDLPRCDKGSERQTVRVKFGDKFWGKCKTKCSCNRVGPDNNRGNNRGNDSDNDSGNGRDKKRR